MREVAGSRVRWRGVATAGVRLTRRRLLRRRGEPLQHLGGRRQRGEPERLLVERGGDSVALLLEASERLLQGPASGEAFVEGLAQEVGVTEGVGDAPAGDGIFVVARVAGERPAGAIGAAIEVGDIGGADEALLLLAA